MNSYDAMKHLCVGDLAKLVQALVDAYMPQYHDAA
jgi:hypothetical protein